MLPNNARAVLEQMLGVLHKEAVTPEREGAIEMVHRLLGTPFYCRVIEIQSPTELLEKIVQTKRRYEGDAIGLHVASRNWVQEIDACLVFHRKGLEQHQRSSQRVVTDFVDLDDSEGGYCD